MDVWLFGGNQPIPTTFVTSVKVSNNADITISASARTGDFAVLADYARAASPPTDVVPTGWTKSFGFSGTAGGTAGQNNFSHKILTGSDPGATITGMASSCEKFMWIFRPARSIKNLSYSSGSGELTVDKPADQAVPANVFKQAIIVGMHLASSPNISAVPAFDAESASGLTEAGYKIYGTAPAAVLVSSTDGGTFNVLGSLAYSLLG